MSRGYGMPHSGSGWPHIAGIASRKAGRPSAGFVAALQHVVMREPAVSADPAARRRWRNERKRARKRARSRS